MFSRSGPPSYVPKATHPYLKLFSSVGTLMSRYLGLSCVQKPDFIQQIHLIYFEMYISK